MRNLNFVDMLARSEFVLAEGAVVERLRREPGPELDPVIAHAAFVLGGARSARLERVYRDYMDIGAATGLPLLSFTSTWRATRERLAERGMDGMDISAAAYCFLDRIRNTYGGYGAQIFIGGLMGCRGDCYKPEEALDAAQAERFHSEQARKLAGSGVDFLFAATMPALPEAAGMARAFASREVPYIVSFVLNTEGRLLDGNSFAEAIRRIDGETTPAPIGYMANCTHHSHFAAALEALPVDLLPRVLGIQANTSAKPHCELDGAAQLDTESPEAFAEGLVALRQRFGLKILGGCCGTGPAHIRALAARATAAAL